MADKAAGLVTPRWLLTAAALTVLAATGITLALPRRLQARWQDAADRCVRELCGAEDAAWGKEVAA